MMHIYNTLTQKKEPLLKRPGERLSIYVCGVTVYDFCHIGNARTFSAFDTIVRYLRFRGYDVQYVRNITDIDDKIINRANENKESYYAIAERFISAMHEDFASLGLLRPDKEPRATEFIPEMITLIAQMLANKHAYVGRKGDVYFNVRSDVKYGCLSHRNIDELESGARVEIASDKKDPLDFVLWKMAKPNEPAWDSPWGKGRPGWHIECSAMSISLLGTSIDMHGGGRDLIFPHHENEIAQSEGATGETFVKCWLHSGFLQIGDEKMSKSLGNFLTLREALTLHPPEVLRYFFMSSHYRSPVIFANDSISQAKQSLDRLYNALRFLEPTTPAEYTSYEKAFIEAMDDDFNTPVALSALFELAHEIQRAREKEPALAAAYGALLKKLGNALGILISDPAIYFQAGSDTDIAKIEALIADRQKARLEKNWQEADRIRDELLVMQVAIEDTTNGTSWKRV